MLLLGSAEAHGQGLWGELSTMGYGGIGVGAAVAAVEPNENGLILAGALLGMIVGRRVGESAEATAMEGDMPGQIHLSATRLGVIAGGGAIGAGIAGLATPDSEGLDRRDWAVLLGGASGALIAATYQVLAERRIQSGVTPSGLAPFWARGPEGSWRVGLRLVPPPRR